MLLCDKYPFLTNYFENGIKNPDKNIAHSILFYGNDLQAQYDLALYISRLLNCKKDKNYDCDCLDCNWIRNSEHPAVLTISRYDNKPDDDDSETVISVKQSNMIKQSLLNSSDFHRVFIFCDKDEDDNVLGLNRFNLQEEAANSLLKTIEEPPVKTTFFFLTKSKEDLISTIISRSQCFFVPSYNIENPDWEDIKDVFENYFEFERKEVFEVAKNLDKINSDSTKTLEQMQNYVLSLMKSNSTNKQIQVKLLHDFEEIEKAKRGINANVSSLNTFENLCLQLIK